MSNCPTASLRALTYFHPATWDSPGKASQWQVQGVPLIAEIDQFLPEHCCKSKQILSLDQLLHKDYKSPVARF